MSYLIYLGTIRLIIDYREKALERRRQMKKRIEDGGGSKDDSEKSSMVNKDIAQSEVKGGQKRKANDTDEGHCDTNKDGVGRGNKRPKVKEVVAVESQGKKKGKAVVERIGLTTRAQAKQPTGKVMDKDLYLPRQM